MQNLQLLRKRNYWLAVWIGVNILDLAITYIALKNYGGIEINPILGQDIVSITVIKSLLVAFISWWIYTRQKAGLAWFSLGALSAVVYVNIFSLLKVVNL
ncbi:DUF5658 family protein [Dehalococcoides mccartyi]|uniref:DUF5658 family protein n=1 Tax=Dehalococcoides mccartyi TaxID=61435 RepID=UPI0003C83B3E|nr:DUF5658 family protein [Dehalococcoides mccartyi]AHB12892.1 putative membrane protein [Dehalococcoides mccartyi GY50]